MEIYQGSFLGYGSGFWVWSLNINFKIKALLRTTPLPQRSWSRLGLSYPTLGF